MGLRNVLTVAYFVLAIYVYGGGVMSTLCYYKSWELVGAQEFPAVHRTVSERILPYFLPFLKLEKMLCHQMAAMHKAAMKLTADSLNFETFHLLKWRGSQTQQHA